MSCYCYFARRKLNLLQIKIYIFYTVKLELFYNEDINAITSSKTIDVGKLNNVKVGFSSKLRSLRSLTDLINKKKIQIIRTMGRHFK